MAAICLGLNVLNLIVIYLNYTLPDLNGGTF